MSVCRLTDTLTRPNGAAAVGVEVTAQMANFTAPNRNTNEVLRAKTNQQGVFSLDLTQGASMRLVIRDLGIDVVVTIPATATTTLSVLVV